MKIVVLLLAAASGAFAQSAADKMLQSSVAVFGTIEENGKTKPVSRGGGFMIDSRHVVTNLTACCGKTDKGEQAQPVVVAGDKDASTAKVIWKNEDTEMAILELKDPFERPALTIAPFKTVEKAEAVYTAQFPDPGESGTIPKISEGKLLGLVKIENSGVQAYKTSASMNKANSGGALFDACGNVIGVNMMVKDGAQFAYVVDPLLEGLKAAGVQGKVASEHCGSAAAAPRFYGIRRCRNRPGMRR
jgi:S1-C subfamily serine protease